MMENAVQFLALGDWGANTKFQKDIANQMAKSVNCSSTSSVFVAALGDNFYDNGVHSVDDPKWKEVFGDVYSNVSCPWYPVLGNHDWQGNTQAQIDYRGDRRWQMDALYCTKVIGNVQFFFLDTTTLCPEVSEMYTDREYSEEDARVQLEWLARQLHQSTAEWRVIFGHYPVYSGGENGSTYEMKQVELLMYRYRVDAYFCGHDHSLQHLYNKHTSIHYFVCGSGSSTGVLRHIPGYTITGLVTAGFIDCVVNSDVMTVRFVSSQGAELYSVNINRQTR